MYKILCATDFSENSQNAALYALNMAKCFNAELFFIASYKVPVIMGGLSKMDEKIHDAVKEDLNTFITKLLTISKLEAAYHMDVVKGNTSDSIIKYAAEKGIDLIIMGAKGSSNIFQMFVGSVVSNVIEKSNIPLLAIPDSATFELEKNNFLLALDTHGIVRESSLDLLAQLKKIPASTINVLHVVLPKETIELNENSGKLVDIIDEIIEVEGLDPVMEIKHYVDQNDVDILVMPRRRHSFIDRTLFESNTLAELFATKVPILVLPDFQ
jgi:nucleotide-binding universal stress UspA family protein